MSWTAKPLSPWWQPDVVQPTSPPHPTPHASLAWGQSTGICYHFPLRLLKITEERQATQRRSQESVPEGKRRILTRSYCLHVRTLCAAHQTNGLFKSKSPPPQELLNGDSIKKNSPLLCQRRSLQHHVTRKLSTETKEEGRGPTGSQNISPELNTVENWPKPAVPKRGGFWFCDSQIMMELLSFFYYLCM